MTAAKDATTDSISLRENLWSNALFPWLVIVYFWIKIATPFRSNIFGFFETIHFERIVIGILLIVTLAGGRIRSIKSPVTALYLLVAFWMLLSYLFSNYQSFENVDWWIKEYWKYLVVFLLISTGIKDRKEAAFILLGFAGVTTLYQTHTWFDFAQGGSYVYQQGIRRIIGVWSGGGLGAANGYASMSVATIPLGYFAYRIGWAPWIRLSGLYAMAISGMSILYSGTRGAFITGAAIIGLIAIKHFGFWRSATAGILLAACTWFLLPPELRDRYTDISLSGAERGMTRAEEISASSAQSRVEGLIDGVNMANDRPILGHGPGSSALARMQYRELERPLQLHNLYGQAMAELGYVGLVFWLALLGTSVASARKIYKLEPATAYVQEMGLCLSYLLIALIIYGAVSHNMLQEEWIFYWSLIVAAARKEVIGRAHPRSEFTRANRGTRQSPLQPAGERSR
ncbi:MAG: O-antigen ligase family protein [Pseudomonadales bacterium]